MCLFAKKESPDNARNVNQTKAMVKQRSLIAIAVASTAVAMAISQPAIACPYSKGVYPKSDRSAISPKPPVDAVQIKRNNPKVNDQNQVLKIGVINSQAQDLGTAAKAAGGVALLLSVGLVTQACRRRSQLIVTTHPEALHPELALTELPNEGRSTHFRDRLEHSGRETLLMR
jgi:hypothetical protein